MTSMAAYQLKDLEKRTILQLRGLARDVHTSMKNDGFDANNTCVGLDDDIKNIKQKKADGMFRDVSKKRSSKNDPNTNTQLGDLDNLYGENDSENSFDDDLVHFFLSTSSPRSTMVGQINIHLIRQVL
ncbi:hypothetical protein RMCBS344292_18665 [Rhizopus microsporus]|nr:hypothetical protein RMCBS344292_18665 [Rhizopus microsporus]